MYCEIINDSLTLSFTHDNTKYIAKITREILDEQKIMVDMREIKAALEHWFITDTKLINNSITLCVTHGMSFPYKLTIKFKPSQEHQEPRQV